MFAYCNNNPISNQDPTGEILISTLILIGAAVVGVAVAAYTGYKARESGCDWADTAFYSIGSGLCAFCSLYTFGMTAYGCYEYYCMLNGMEPVTEVGTKSAQLSTVPPQEAYDTYYYAQTHNGAPPLGQKGGSVFNNDGRNGSQVLPYSSGPYREYDIYPKVIGVNRGSERIVIGADASAWYTPDHYISFIKMEVE